jgi:hypothetical protein
MSWWDTGHNDDVTGDQPADFTRQALKRLVASRSERSEKRPALADVLQAIALVALRTGNDALADSPTHMPQITAKLESGESISSKLSHTDNTDNTLGDIVEALNDSLQEIVRVYHERWERKPRLSEWLYAFEFVLGYRPEDYLIDGTSHAPVKLTATIL